MFVEDTMKKKSLIIALILIVVIALIGLGACSSTKNEIEIQDEVVSRFGDGITVLSTNVAPRTATEYKNVERVSAKVNVDARMSGYHITGLYLPAGETLTITVPKEVRQNYYSVYVDAYSSDKRVSKSISGVQVELTSATGGIVEIYVPPISDSTSSSSTSSFNMWIEGGIVIPYYRLGRDSLEQINRGNGEFAVLDCVNTRFYVPTSILYDDKKKCKIDDLYNVLLWWQSAVSFVNETLGIASTSRDYTSSIIYGDYDEIFYDATARVSYAPASYFEKTLFYSCLLNGESWDLLYSICDYKTQIVGGNLAGFIPQDSWVNVLSAIAHVVMTNPSEHHHISDNEINWLHDPYLCLEGTLDLLSSTNEDLYQNHYNDMWKAFFVNILHSFGLDKTIEIISEYRKETQPLDADGFALLISSVLRSDMSMYFDMFPIMQISQESKSEMSGKQLFVPVQTKFTLGSSDNTFSLGYTVNIGEKAVFDFGNNIISLDGGWRVEELVGRHPKLWSRDNDNPNIYYYNPNQDTLIDEFDVTLTNGYYTVTLYGKINVVITVAISKKYVNWSFSNPSTALSEAIDGYSKRTPDYVESIDYAGVRPIGEKNDSVYVLSVTSGCIRVPKSGKYRFYLRNNGRCRVEFGVPKYMFDMFDISIPFSAFTRGHSYDIDLKAGTNYYFNLYLLSTMGSCDAALGIRYIEGENIMDSNQDKVDQAVVIDSNYLIHNGLADDKVVKFEPPLIYPTGYGYKSAFYQPYVSPYTKDKDDKLIEEYSVESYPDALSAAREIEYAFDELNSSYYTAAEYLNEFNIVFNMKGEKRMEYVQFYVNSSSSTVGKKVKITVSNHKNFSESKEIDLKELTEDETNEGANGDNTIRAGLNTFLFNACEYKFLKITLYDEEPFECSFTDFKVGQRFDASQIVPNTSSSIAYMGGWSDISEYVCINGSVSQSVSKNSVMSFTALAKQICIYGVKDSSYGRMEVYVDGSKVATVNLKNDTTLTDQLLFAIDFDLWAEHTVKIMPASNDDKINIDYISYIPVETEEIREYSGFIYGIIALPSAIAIALVGAAIADYRTKKKRNAKKFEKQ